MTSTVLPTVHADDADLTSLGYQPTLHRKLGRYASFAAGFSFVSILTTIFQLFAFGYSFAGPAFFWTWPVVLIGQLLVALNFAELAARSGRSGDPAVRFESVGAARPLPSRVEVRPTRPPKK